MSYSNSLANNSADLKANKTAGMDGVPPGMFKVWSDDW